MLSRLAKPGVAIVATLLALLVSEGLVRALGRAPDVKAIQLGSSQCVYRRSTNPVLGFELKADYRNDNPDFIQSYERTNSHAQRDRERTMEKPAGVRRILLLGDSVVEGYGLREDATISRQLEELYTDGAIEVLNFGVSAYCTRAEVELLEVKGLRFDPDLVILVFVENDFDNFNREAFPLGGTIERPAVVQSLFVRSQLFRLACVQCNWFHFGAEMDPVRWNQDAIGDNNVDQGLRRFRELADAHGFSPLVAIWPRFFDDRIADVHFLPDDDGELVIERLASIHGVPSVRLSEPLQQLATSADGVRNPRLRYTTGDGLHPSAEGGRAAAQVLKQTLADLDAGRLATMAKTIRSADAGSAAVAAARALGKDTPSYVRVYNRLGNDLLKSGKLPDAVDQFEKALEEDPNHAPTYNNLGIAYERLGRVAEALAQFEYALQLEPDFVHPRFNRARILLKQGRVNEALAEFQKTLQIDPDHLGALRTLGVELGKREGLAQAQSYLERAVRIDPEHTETHNNLGVVYAALGRTAEAVAQFQEALRVDPVNARAAENLRSMQSVIQPKP